MNSDGTSFLSRARVFFTELRKETYPNAGSLSSLCCCSRNTAQRTIYRLRDEYYIPFDYDLSRRGYYLTNHDFEFPVLLPPGKDELASLLLARELVRHLDVFDLNERLDSLWRQFALHNKAVARDLEPLSRVFSSDSTGLSRLADQGVLSFVTAATSGASLRLGYRSPWRHAADKNYLGWIQRVHFSDDTLYLLFEKDDGSEIILNASFVKSFQVLDYDLPRPAKLSLAPRSAYWLDGFGVWAGSAPETIVVEILPPASHYYASQVWHDDQDDRWDDEVLIRSLRAILSPEIVRRILSLGQYVRTVRPDALRQAVADAAEQLLTALKQEETTPRSEVGV